MTDPAPEPTSVAVFGDGSALGSAAAVAAMLDAVFPTPDARSRAAALLARRDRPAREETADSLLVALTGLLQEDAADPDVGKALAALRAHEAATRRNLRLYDPGARANPDAVWWPVPNHPKRPRRATDELPWAQRHPILDRTTPVGSAGSCFASEVAHRLQRDGFRYVVTQPNRTPTSGTHNACCRWGTIFNVASFRQLIERAYGAWTPPLLFGEHHDGGALQLSDPWLDAVTYVSVEEALSAQAALSEAARAAFDSVEVFVFTMGLAEVWRLKATGDVLARMPISMPRHLVEPAVLGFEENVAELERLWALWKRHNPKVKLILSVSPIPLNATFQADEQHVIAATCEAKSILRAAAGAFARRHEDVYYLPSYDLVSYCVTHPWTEDGRHVTRRTVDRVMGLFDHLFVRPGGDAPLQLPRDCVVIDQRSGIDRDAVSVVLQVLRERGERPPVAVLLSPGADPAAAGEALAGLRHPGGSGCSRHPTERRAGAGPVRRATAGDRARMRRFAGWSSRPCCPRARRPGWPSRSGWRTAGGAAGRRGAPAPAARSQRAAGGGAAGRSAAGPGAGVGYGPGPAHPPSDERGRPGAAQRRPPPAGPATPPLRGPAPRDGRAGRPRRGGSPGARPGARPRRRDGVAHPTGFGRGGAAGGLRAPRPCRPHPPGQPWPGPGPARRRRPHARYDFLESVLAEQADASSWHWTRRSAPWRAPTSDATPSSTSSSSGGAPRSGRPTRRVRRTSGTCRGRPRTGCSCS